MPTVIDWHDSYRHVHVCMHITPEGKKVTITQWLSNIYNIRVRVVSDIQTRAEGEWLYI